MSDGVAPWWVDFVKAGGAFTVAFVCFCVLLWFLWSKVLKPVNDSNTAMVVSQAAAAEAQRAAAEAQKLAAQASADAAKESRQQTEILRDLVQDLLSHRRNAA